MALTNCKECGNQISKKTKECPKCGAPTKRRGLFLTLARWFVIIFVILPIGAIIFRSVYQYQTHITSTTTARNSSSTSSPAATSSTPLLELQYWKCYKEHSYVFIEGEVKNVSNINLKNVVAVGTFRTKDGEYVKTEDSLIDYNPILPGQTSPFKAGGTENPEIERCEVNFRYLMGGTIAFTKKGQ